MNMTNERITAILVHLFSALATCAKACARTREMVKRAISKYLDMVAA
jgi:hypothetical protein